MKKIKDFFLIIWHYVSFPYYWISTRKIDKFIRQVAADDRAALLDEKDVEFLRSIGIDTDLETLRNGGRKNK